MRHQCRFVLVLAIIFSLAPVEPAEAKASPLQCTKSMQKMPNANICAVNMKINGHIVCAICVYMPHAGRSSNEQENVYEALKVIIKKARQQKRILIIGGDFNAVVGRTNDCEIDKWEQTQICGAMDMVSETKRTKTTSLLQPRTFNTSKHAF